MKKQYNILFIMADQFRTATMTGLGDGIETPNIDRIRAMSVFYPQATCPAPLCTPSRASLATGKMPHNCGVIAHDSNLPLDQPTYYQRLVKAGYRVSVVGKTDLHKKTRFIRRKGDLPVIHHIGFTDPRETEGKMNSARILRQDSEGKASHLGPYQYHLLHKDPALLQKLNDTYVAYMQKKRPVYDAWETHLEADDFLDNFIGRECCRFLEEDDGEAPWHLLASFAGPHNPWDPPREDFEQVRDLAVSLPPSDDLTGKPEWVKRRAAIQSKGLTDALLQNTKRHYAASVAVIDRWIGQMLDILEARGQLDSTVIIFTADHGEQMGEHGLFEKNVMYEGALKIPLLIHLPGMNSPSESGQLASLMDLGPTLMDLAGASYDPTDLDAVSLLPDLQGDHAPVREVVQSELISTIMLYDGRYKWIRSYNDSSELYDLQEDPDELHNCIDAHPEVIKRLQKFTFRH